MKIDKGFYLTILPLLTGLLVYMFSAKDIYALITFLVLECIFFIHMFMVYRKDKSNNLVSHKNVIFNIEILIIGTLSFIGLYLLKTYAVTEFSITNFFFIALVILHAIPFGFMIGVGIKLLHKNTYSFTRSKKIFYIILITLSLIGQTISFLLAPTFQSFHTEVTFHYYLLSAVMVGLPVSIILGVLKLIPLLKEKR